MPLRTGLAAQLGHARESTHGTYVAPTRFLEFVSESLSLEIDRLESAGLRAGTRVQRSDRWRSGARSVSGDVQFEIQSTGLGAILEDIFGGVVTANPEASVFTHTFTPGDLPVGATYQVGRPSTNGTVNPFSYVGCKVASALFAGRVGEIGEISVSLDAQDEDTGQSLGSATYPANELLTFVEATLSLGGSPIDVRSWELSCDNGLATDRNRLSSALRKEPLEAAMRTYDGSIEAYFDDLTDYNRFAAGTEAALVVTFEGALIGATLTTRLQFTMNVRTDGDTPTVSGPDEIPQNLSYKVVGNTSPISVEYRTTDTTP